VLVLVTGGTGFIGRSLCNRLLAEGHSVAVLSRQPAKVAGLFGSQITPIEFPNRSAALAGCDAIINLAGAPIFG
jgi:NAD dependent epimerase/dehydratase family enzyme